MPPPHRTQAAEADKTTPAGYVTAPTKAPEPAGRVGQSSVLATGSVGTAVAVVGTPVSDIATIPYQPQPEPERVNGDTPTTVTGALCGAGGCCHDGSHNHHCQDLLRTEINPYLSRIPIWGQKEEKVLRMVVGSRGL